MEVAKRLREQGYRIEILATDPSARVSEETISDGLMIRTFPAIAPQNSYDFSLGLYKAIKGTTSDILHVHGFYAFHAPLAALARQRYQKFILTIHSCASSSLLREILRIPYYLICRKILTNVDKIICLSKEEYYRFKRHLGFPSNLYTIIPNGVNIHEFKQSDNDQVLEDPYVLSVGRLEKCKGFHFLIQGFKKLQNEYPKLNLVIVGSGPYKPYLQRLIRRLNLEEKVRLYEKIPRKNLVSLYTHCALFVLLSKGEGWPITVLEALAARKPILLTLSSGLTEYVRRGLALGVRYPPDPNTISKNISSILENPGVYVPKGAKIPTWDDVADKLDRLYRSLLAHAAPEGFANKGLTA